MQEDTVALLLRFNVVNILLDIKLENYVVKSSVQYILKKRRSIPKSIVFKC